MHHGCSGRHDDICLQNASHLSLLWAPNHVPQVMTATCASACHACSWPLLLQGLPTSAEGLPARQAPQTMSPKGTASKSVSLQGLGAWLNWLTQTC